MNEIIKIGTRESKLALVQSQLIMNEIKKIYPHVKFELIKIKTKGDIILDTKLDLVGGKGMFVKELEHALLQGEIDMAVHSMKDVPMDLPEGLTIGAVTKRADPRDVLVTLDGKTVNELPTGAIVGTSSIRRELLILDKRPDIKIKLLRGNVLTRLNKLNNKEYDAIILAAAGLERLGLMDKCSETFEVSQFIPDVGQGILGIEVKKGDKIQSIIDKINNEEAALQLKAERAYMKSLGGGCSTPIAAHAVIEGEGMKVYGMYATGDDLRIIRASIEGNKHEAYDLGINLADIIKVKRV